MEFQESDIIFSDEYNFSSGQSSPHESQSSSTSFRGRNKVMRKMKDEQRGSSAPLSIPGSNSSSPSSSFRYDGVGLDCFEDGFIDDNEIVPPHVIVDRRSGDLYKNVQGKKNLIHFRNSVLKLTGFLES